MVERKFERREPRKAKWWKGGGSLSFRPFLSQPSSTSSERTFLDCKQGQVRLTVFKLSNLVPACRRMTEGEKVRFKFAPSSSVVPEEYWVVANIGMAAKWKQDPSIPLTDVLQSFGIFKGHGKAGQAPQADLLFVPLPCRVLLYFSSEPLYYCSSSLLLLQEGIWNERPGCCNQEDTGRRGG